MAESDAREGRGAGKAADIRRIAAPELSTANSPLSHVVIDGSYAFLSGIVASDLPGGAAVHGDVARETEVVMAPSGKPWPTSGSAWSESSASTRI